MDEPDLVPYGYPSDVAIETLGLVPFRIVPHVDSDHQGGGQPAANGPRR